MNLAAICFLGGLLLVIKIIIHCWLLSKVRRFKWLSTDFSRLQFVAPVYFEVPKDFKEIKIVANIIYTLSLVCFTIYAIGVLKDS
jgi:hypothetical protein